MEEINEVFIYPDFLEHKVQIGAQLNNTLKDQIVSFLSESYDCFAWSHEDMIWIDPEVAIHRLEVDQDHLPIK